ncbi:FAD-linked oxidase C-terminal domain-containing protein [Corynebacterium diphtheriae]
MPREKGELAMAALHSLSRHFDPAGRLNPGTLLED